MKILITEQQIEKIAHQFTLDMLNNMEYRKHKNKDFDFFEKGEGQKRADHGIEADWMKHEKGYSILVGNSLWRTVQDMFNLTDDQVQTAFIKAFIDKGITKIIEVSTLDFSKYDNF
jgi:hypothetical protein